MSVPSFAETRTTPAQLGDVLRMIEVIPDEYRQDRFALLAAELLQARHTDENSALVE